MKKNKPYGSSDSSNDHHQSRGDGTESVSSFEVVDQNNQSGGGGGGGLLAPPPPQTDPDSASVSEWSYTGDDSYDGAGSGAGGGQKGFVNRCVSKVRSLVKQGSPTPQ